MVSTRVLCLLILVASAAAQDNGNQNDLTQNGGGQNGGTQNEPDQNGAQGQGNGVTTTTTVASGGVSICADSSGNLTPASTACSNVIADAACAAVFTPIAGTDASRDPKCMSSDTYYQNLAKQCMKTCGMCCTMPNYSCTDKPNFDCEKVRPNCNTTNQVLRDMIAQSCPLTCGLCSGSCVDKSPLCALTVKDCRDASRYEAMKEECPATCGFCSPSGGSPSDCQDSADYAPMCVRNVHLCGDSRYRDFFLRKCRKTCNLCSVQPPQKPIRVGPNGICADSNVNCDIWKRNGFCESTFYSADVKKQCAYSCNLC